MSGRYLIISHFYKPTGNPRALRWSALAERWAALGCHVDVICGWGSGLARIENINGVNVYRCNAEFLERLHNKFKRSSPPTLRSANISPSLTRSSFRSKLTAPARWLFQHLYWPDREFLWYRPAVQQAMTLVSGSYYDALISVSNPFTGHLVGRRIHDVFPKLRWFVDIGDPFSFGIIKLNNSRLYSSLNHYVERRIFRLADALSVTTKGVLEGYQARFPESASKITLIPALIYIKDAPRLPPIPLAKDHTIKLVFAGRFYSKMRRPDYMLKLYSALIQKYPDVPIELHIFGNARDAIRAFDPFEALLGRKIFMYGEIGHDEVVQAMQQATALVNIGNDSLYAFDSKLVEYAIVGKPIVNLIPFAEHSSVDFLKPYSAVLNVVKDTDNNLVNQVDELYFFLTKSHSIDMNKVREWLTTYQIDSIGTAYDRLIGTAKESTMQGANSKTIELSPRA